MKWEKIIKYADKCTFEYETNIEYHFKLPEDIFGGPYGVCLWKGETSGYLEDLSAYANMVSIHSRTDYILSTFDKYHSRKMGKILKKKLNI